MSNEKVENFIENSGIDPDVFDPQMRRYGFGYDQVIRLIREYADQEVREWKGKYSDLNEMYDEFGYHKDHNSNLYKIEALEADNERLKLALAEEIAFDETGKGTPDDVRHRNKQLLNPSEDED